MGTYFFDQVNYDQLDYIYKLKINPNLKKNIYLIK